MIYPPHDIDQLLERYYDGTTSPDEEFVLYLELLKESPQTPHYADRMLLEATLQRASSQTIINEGSLLNLQAPSRWQLWIRKYGVAAAVLITGGVGLSLLSQWGQDSRQAELSLRNGQPIPQEQVDEYTLAAFSHLSDCVQRCSEQHEEIGGLLDRLHTSYRSSMDKISLDAEGGWILASN